MHEKAYLGLGAVVAAPQEGRRVLHRVPTELLPPGARHLLQQRRRGLVPVRDTEIGGRWIGDRRIDRVLGRIRLQSASE